MKKAEGPALLTWSDGEISPVRPNPVALPDSPQATAQPLHAPKTPSSPQEELQQLSADIHALKERLQHDARLHGLPTIPAWSQDGQETPRNKLTTELSLTPSTPPQRGVNSEVERLQNENERLILELMTLRSRLESSGSRLMVHDNYMPQPDEEAVASSSSSEPTKFASTLTYGSLKEFNQGLGGLIGPPSPNLEAAMEAEHIKLRGSRRPFVTSNTKMETTNEIEYWFVKEPTPERLEKLQDPAPAAAPGAKLSDWPKESNGTPETHQRRPRKLDEFRPEREKRDARLRAVGVDPLITVEFVGARLYTGPLFTKYNFVLR